MERILQEKSISSGLYHIIDHVKNLPLLKYPYYNGAYRKKQKERKWPGCIINIVIRELNRYFNKVMALMVRC